MPQEIGGLTGSGEPVPPIGLRAEGPGLTATATSQTVQLPFLPQRPFGRANRSEKTKRAQKSIAQLDETTETFTVTWFESIDELAHPHAGWTGETGGRSPNGVCRPSVKERSMLVLSRKKDESIVINNDITIVVVEIRGDKVRLGVEAPKEVPVHRREVFDAIARGDDVLPDADSSSAVLSSPAIGVADSAAATAGLDDRQSESLS